MSDKMREALERAAAVLEADAAPSVRDEAARACREALAQAEQRGDAQLTQVMVDAGVRAWHLAVGKLLDDVVSDVWKAMAAVASPAPVVPDEVAKMRDLLRRYRTETPLCHQPHMIALEVDELLAAAQEASRG